MSHFLTTLENIFSPAIQEAVNFAHTLEADVEGAESEAIQAAFIAGTAAYEAATGTLEAKALAALEAIGTSLLGEAVTVVKTAAGTVATPEPTISPA